MVNKYGHSGWYKESRRHSLAAQGVSTNRYFRKKRAPAVPGMSRSGNVKEYIQFGDKTYLKGSEPQFKPRGEEFWRKQAINIGLTGNDVEDYVSEKMDRTSIGKHKGVAAGSGAAVESDIQDIMVRNELRERFAHLPPSERDDAVADRMKQYLRNKLRLYQLENQAKLRRGIGISMLQSDISAMRRKVKEDVAEIASLKAKKFSAELRGNVDEAKDYGEKVDILMAEVGKLKGDIEYSKNIGTGLKSDLGDPVTKEIERIEEYIEDVMPSGKRSDMSRVRGKAVGEVVDRMEDVINRQNVDVRKKIRDAADTNRKLRAVQDELDVAVGDRRVMLEDDEAELINKLSNQIKAIQMEKSSSRVAGVVRPKAGGSLVGVETVRKGGVEGHLPQVKRDKVTIGLGEKEQPWTITPDGQIVTTTVKQQKFGEAAPERRRTVVFGKELPFEREEHEEKVQRARGILPDVVIVKSAVPIQKIDIGEISELGGAVIPTLKKVVERAERRIITKKAEEYGAEEAKLKEKRRSTSPEGGGLSAVEKELAAQTIYSGGGEMKPKVHRMTGKPIRQLSYGEREKARKIESRMEREQLQARMAGTQVTNISKRRREAAPILRNPKPESAPVKPLPPSSPTAQQLIDEVVSEGRL